MRAATRLRLPLAIAVGLIVVSCLLSSASAGGSSADNGYAQTVLADNPVTFWMLDETSGKTVADASGNGHDGSYIGSPLLSAQTAPMGSGAVTLTNAAGGAGQRIDIPYSSALNPSTYTLEAWVNPAELPSAGSGGGFDSKSILCSRSIGATSGYHLYMSGYSGHPQFAFIAGTGSSGLRFVYDDVNTPEVGRWYHVVATMDGANLQLYVNGQLVTGPQLGSGYSFPPNCTNPAHIGACENSSGALSYGYSGSLADIAIYDQVLSPAEILAHYQAGTATPPPTSEPALTLSPQSATSLLAGDHASFKVSVENVPDGTTLTATITHENEESESIAVDNATRTFSYTNSNPGTDMVEVSATVAGDTVSSDPVDVYWLSSGNSPGNSSGEPGGSLYAITDQVLRMADPINSATGNFYQSVTDAELPGTGIPFSFERTYNSRDTAVGPLGKGWSASAYTSLATDGVGNVTLKSGDGQEVGFILEDDGSYAGDSNVTANLTKTGSGYDLLLHDQEIQHFDSAGRLVSWLDQNGQGLHFAYGDGRLVNVTDSGGRETALDYDDQGHLIRVTLPDATALSYGYEGDFLTSFKDQTGAVTTYAYDNKGFLTSATDPTERLFFENEYDDLGRVVKQKDALGHESEFDWSDGHVVATDAAGSEWKAVYNGEGQASKLIDALGNASDYVFNDSNSQLSSVDPLGNTTTMTYDERENMLSRTDALGNVESWTYDENNNTTSHTDQLGHTTQFRYDSKGNLISQTDPMGSVTTYEYDSAGRQISITDPLRRTTRTVYDDKGNLIATISPSGAKTTMRYNTAGLVVAEVDPRGNEPGADPDRFTTTSEYDATGRLIKTTDPLGHSTTSTYDDAGRLVAKTDANGNTTRYVYDGAGRQVAVINPDGSTTRSAYDSVDNLISTTDALGNVTRYEYDAAGRQIASISPTGERTTTTYDANGDAIAEADPLADTTTTYDVLGREIESKDSLGRTTKTVYDAAGNVVKKIDPLGNTTTSSYDAAGRVIKQTDPLGYFTTSSYDATGQLVAETDANGHTTHHAYDEDGREISSISPTGAVTTSTYDTAGNLIRRTDANGHATTHAYNAVGNEISETNPLGARIAFAYDANGNLVSSTDPLGHTTMTVYDSMNRQISTTDALGRTKKTAYDANGNAVKKTDPLGNVTTSDYDAEGRLVSETDSLGHATAYAYDAAGQLVVKADANAHTIHYAYDAVGDKTSVTAADGSVTHYVYDSNGSTIKRTDANGHVTTYSYDAAGNKISTSNALGSIWAYSYDANGNLIQTKTPSGGTIGQTYDAENRLLKKSYSDGTPSVSYTYDPAGNKLSMTDGTGTTRYGYDAADRRVGALSASGAFLYRYDADGNLLSRTYPNGLETTYSYDDAGEMVAATVKGKITRYTYDALGNLASTLHPSGILDSRSYDTAGRVTDISGKSKDGKPFYSRSYTYDPVGNPLTLKATSTRNHAFSSWGHKDKSLSRWTETYSYDSRDRLTQACMNARCSRYFNYSYDPVGNRTSRKTRKETTLYSYDVADELLSESTQRHGHHQEVTRYAYDLNGNQTQAGSTRYTYNLENKLTQATGEGKNVSYTYTGDGLMATRSTRSDTTGYSWDTSSGLGELALEIDSRGSGKFAIKDTRSYTYGMGALGIVAGKETYAFHTDALGSVVQLSDGRGELVESYRYSPYGEDYSPGFSGGAEDYELNPIRFTGQYLDSESDLYDMRAREYDPSIGRFLQTDPAECSSDGSCASTYIYADDQPTVLLDPSGEGAVSIEGPPIRRKRLHVTFLVYGTPRQPNPGAYNWADPEILNKNGDRPRFCGINPRNKRFVITKSQGRTSPVWVYDDTNPTDPSHANEPKKIKRCVGNAGLHSGYVYMDSRWVKYKKQIGRYVLRYYAELYTSRNNDPGTSIRGLLRKWSYGRGSPVLSVNDDAATVKKYVSRVCSSSKLKAGSWMGIWNLRGKPYTESINNAKLAAIETALNKCTGPR